MADLASSNQLMKEVKGKVGKVGLNKKNATLKSSIPQSTAMTAVKAKQLAKGHSPTNPAGKIKGWAKGNPLNPAQRPQLPQKGKITLGGDRSLSPVKSSPVLNPAQRIQKPQSGTVKLGDTSTKVTPVMPVGHTGNSKGKAKGHAVPNRGRAVSQSRHIRNRAAKAFRSYGKGKFRPGA
jgi:hypothetical protein